MIAAFTDLVDFIDEDDAVLLDRLDCAELDVLIVDHLVGLFFLEGLQGFLDLELAGLGAIRMQILKHVLQLIAHLLHTRRRHDFHADLARAHLDVNVLVIQIAFSQLLAEFLTGGRFLLARFITAPAGDAGQQGVEHALLGSHLRASLHVFHLFLTRHLDGGIDQVANDGFDIAAHIAHFGEFGRLDLDEGRICQTRQSAGDFGLADAGRADHQDVLRRDFFPQPRFNLRPPPAIAQRDGDRALGIGLANDVLVQFLDDFPWRHRRHDLFGSAGTSSSSMVRL